MNWTNNVIPSFLENKKWDKLEDFQDSSNDRILISITDNSMYDTYEKDDLVWVKIDSTIPGDRACLILIEDEVLFRDLIEFDEENFKISQSFPESFQILPKEKVKVLGYATSILRT